MEIGEVTSQTQSRDFATELVRGLRVLRRRWPVIVVCCILGVAGSLAYSLTRPNKYTADAEILFTNPQLDQTLFGTNPLPAETDPTRAAATNAALAGLRQISGMTSKALGGAVSARQVTNETSIQPAGQSDIVMVAVTDQSPQRAAVIANEYARQFITLRIEQGRSTILQAQQLVRSQYNALPASARTGSAGRELSNTARELETLAALQTGNAEFVQQATPPTQPSSPHPVTDAILGGLGGLLVGIGLAFLLDRLDRRVRNEAEIEEIADIPMLAAIPLSDKLAARRNPAALDGVELEAFRLLRTRLRYFNVDRDIRTLLVSSAAPGEGKTTVATDLAGASASMGARVLLLEADLRRPTLTRSLGLKAGPGLVELLTQPDVDLDMAVRRVSVEQRGSNGRPARELEVLPAGAIAPNPLEFLESRKMEALLSDLKAIYDFVVIDTPPTTVIPDALPLMGKVDGVLLVCRIGQSTRDAVRYTVRQLHDLAAPVLGFVANGVPLGSSGYGYGYDYTHPVENTRGSDTEVAVAPRE